MALETSIYDLIDNFCRLREALELFRVTVAEDKPTRGDLALVDRLSDIADDLRGSMEEAIGGARAALESTRTAFDGPTVRREIARSQKQMEQIWDKTANELFTYEQIAELENLKKERKGEWSAWAKVVREAIERCRPLLAAAMQKLSVVWQELAERAAATNVSVRNTTIGQHVIAPRVMQPTGSGD